MRDFAIVDRMKKRWGVEDIIDFEYFLFTDEEADADSSSFQIHQRDRKVFTDHISPQLESSHGDQQKEILKLWLEHRRQISKSSIKFPGRIVSETLSLIGLLTALVGIVAGMSLSSYLLRYDGTVPVNWVSFLGIILLPQLALMAFLLASQAVSGKERFSLHKSFFYTLAFELLQNSMLRVRKKYLLLLTKKQKDTQEASRLFMKISQATRQYGGLWFWQIFNLSQLLAMSFNLSVLSTLSAKIFFTDMAFGWQTTLASGVETISRLVQIVAIPWNWALPGTVPSIEQIAGSQIVLKDGVYHLASSDLSGWWPFLCMALVVYGLLPRVLLFVFGTLLRDRSLERLQFVGLPHSSLLYRLTTPVVTSTAPTPPEEPLASTAVEKKDTKPETLPTNEVVVLVHEDISTPSGGDDLEYHLAAKQLSVVDILPLPMESPEELEEMLGEHLGREDIPLVLLLEGWMPPIEDDLSYIRELPHVIGENRLVHICLVGKPDTDSAYTAVSEKDMKIWKSKIATIDNQHILLTPLIYG